MLDLQNISQNTLRIIWNEAVFIDANGKTSKIIHNEVKLDQKENDQLASVIISGARLEDTATPTVNIHYSNLRSLRGWQISDLYQDNNSLSPSEIKLTLPIKVKEVINEYIFVFEIEKVFNYPQKTAQIKN